MITGEILEPLIGRQITLCRSDFFSKIIGTIDSILMETVHLDLGYGRIEVIPFSRIALVEFYGDDGFLKTAYPVPEKTITAEEVRGKLSPTPSRYQWSYKGVSFDFYRLCEILGVKHHAQSHALKKVIRAGRSVKSLETDIDEAIDALKRWKEMVLEDKNL